MAAPRVKSLLLPAQLHADAAEDVRQSLKDGLKAKAPLHIDASEVTHVSTSYIQLLLACLRADRPAKIMHPSAALLAAWADFGLYSSFPLEQ